MAIQPYSSERLSVFQRNHLLSVAKCDKIYHIRSYHMGDACWVCVLLDGAVLLDEICARIDERFCNTL